MKKYLFVLAAIASFNCVLAQTADKRTWNWYFGSAAAVMFTSQSLPPTPVTTSTMSANEGSSAISDSAGNLLFYTDGQMAWSANNLVMPNGYGLKGHFWSAQSGLLVPMPGSSTLFYLFTVNNWSDATTELNYSVVDRTLNNGLGDITSQKNVLVNSNCREQLTAVYHSNGQDIWILSHEFGNNNFVAYLLTSQGLSMTPVISPAGAVNDGWNRYGYLKVSPSCNKIASALGGQGFILQDTTVQVCDFDNSTGVVSNAVFLADYFGIAAAYGCEFSPDNTKLYVTEFNGQNIFQYDLTAANIAATQTNIAQNNGINKSSLALGPDGKIYVCRQGHGELGAIDLPDLPGVSCNYNDTEVPLPVGVNTIGVCNTFHSCSATTSVFSIDRQKNRIDVFPNPADYMITVKGFYPENSGSMIKSKIKISDVTGRIIYETEQEIKNKTLNTKISVSSFPAGIYFLSVDMDGKIFSKKILVE
jgi:type IX secretion system substrate protein